MPIGGSDRNPRPLRSILPAKAASLLTPEASPVSNRTPITTACNNCRKTKCRCTGERPSCRRCVRLRFPCHYETRPGETKAAALKRINRDMKHRSTNHEDMFELLQTLPDREALDVFRRIRSGADITTILNQVKTGNLLLQMSVSPETRFRYDFPYRSEMPRELLVDNPYLNSPLYDSTSLQLTGNDTQLPGQAGTDFLSRLPSREYRHLYLKPFHAATVVEPRLSDVKPSLWTTVCQDDVLMRALLGVFFHCEYQFAAAFHKDYFLDDMTTQREEFCSPLLVNIVLAYSCVCYQQLSDRAEYWNPHTLTYRFFVEAKRIWELEAVEPRITTIQTGILFSVFYNLSGLDQIGKAYRIHAIALSHRIRLFDSDMHIHGARMRKGRAYTAWALYNWETLTAFSFLHAPLLKKPPDWPLPDPTKNPDWYGETWVRYPMSQSLLPLCFGYIFQAKSQFRVIMNEFCEAVFSTSTGIAIDKAYGLLTQLKDWENNLPEPLRTTSIVLPGQLQLHMYFHHLILTIFKPLLGTKVDRKPSPQEIVADANKHLQTLIRLYYLRHGFDAMDSFIVIPLMLTGCDCLDAIEGEQLPKYQLETLRSTLILIVKGLYSQGHNHYVAEALFRVIKGRLRSEELTLLQGSVKLDKVEPEGQQRMIQKVRSHWPVSVVKNKEDMDAFLLTNLVEQYAHLNVGEG